MPVHVSIPAALLRLIGDRDGIRVYATQAVCEQFHLDLCDEGLRVTPVAPEPFRRVLHAIAEIEVSAPAGAYRECSDIASNLMFEPHDAATRVFHPIASDDCRTIDAVYLGLESDAEDPAFRSALFRHFAQELPYGQASGGELWERPEDGSCELPIGPGTSDRLRTGELALLNWAAWCAARPEGAALLLNADDESVVEAVRLAHVDRGVACPVWCADELTAAGFILECISAQAGAVDRSERGTSVDELVEAVAARPIDLVLLMLPRDQRAALTAFRTAHRVLRSGGLLAVHPALTREGPPRESHEAILVGQLLLRGESYCPLAAAGRLLVLQKRERTEVPG